jgi:hypothetical protein
VVGETSDGKAVYEPHTQRLLHGDATYLLAAFKKSAAHKQLQRQYRDQIKTMKRSVRKRGLRRLVVTRKLMARAMCKCLNKPNGPDKTACTYCSVVKKNLYTYHKARVVWKKMGGRDPCGACGGHCLWGKPYQRLSRNVDELVDVLLCPAERRSYFDIPHCDQNGRPYGVRGVLRQWILKVEKRLFNEELVDKVFDRVDEYVPTVSRQSLPPRKCVAGSCGGCGFPNIFKDMNEGKPITFIQDGEEHDLYGFCPREATNDAFKWSAWGTVHDGQDKDGNDTYRDDWVPRRGTRAQFLFFLQTAIVDWLPHEAQRKDFEHQWKRAEHFIMDRTAVTGLLPAQGRPALSGWDFASTVDHCKPFGLTCQWDGRSQLLSGFTAHTPRLLFPSMVSHKGKSHTRSLGAPFRSTK